MDAPRLTSFLYCIKLSVFKGDAVSVPTSLQLFSVPCGRGVLVPRQRERQALTAHQSQLQQPQPHVYAQTTTRLHHRTLSAQQQCKSSSTHAFYPLMIQLFTAL